MRIKDVCAHEVARINRNASLRQATEELAGGEIGILAVEDAGMVCGVLSERDIVRAVFEEANFDDTRAWEYMTESVVSIDEEAPLEEGIRKMHDAQVRHLLVTGQDDFVGVISTRDLVRVRAPDVLRVRQEA